MGIFRFRLEKVSEHRQRQVDRCSLAVANANQRLEQIKKMQARLENDIQRQAQVMADRRGGEVSSRDFVAGTAWLNHRYEQAESLGQMMARNVEELAEARDQLARAWRDLEVLSRLRVRQEADWQLVQDRRDRREMDEIGQLRAHRGLKTKSAH